MPTILLVLSTSLMLSGPPASPAADKVSICHFPPGNPLWIQLIQVGEKAAATHFNQHGDFEDLGTDINGVGCNFCADTEDEACQYFCLAPPPCICPADSPECCESNPCCVNCPEPRPRECDVITCACEPTDCCVTVCSAMP